MSKLCCKFQIPASNIVGGVAETQTRLQSVMDGQTDGWKNKGKTICPSPLRGRGIKITGKIIIHFKVRLITFKNLN